MVTIYEQADMIELKFSPEGGGEHPDFTRADWVDAVNNDDTISGYWVWVASELINAEENEDDEDDEDDQDD